MFKGHPKGLIAAALANMGERFGYYIMNAVLVLFLCSKFGLSEETSGTIYSFFYAGIYLLALVGGAIADRTQNYKGTIRTGLIIMAKCRKLGIIGHSVRSQPPFSQKGRNKRSNQTTHINKYIKNLESAIPFAFRNLQSLRALFCSLCLKIVIQLPHNSLQISLKQTITKSYHKQCKTGKRKQPSYIRTRC